MNTWCWAKIEYCLYIYIYIHDLELKIKIKTMCMIRMAKPSIHIGSIVIWISINISINIQILQPSKFQNTHLSSPDPLTKSDCSYPSIVHCASACNMPKVSKSHCSSPGWREDSWIYPSGFAETEVSKFYPIKGLTYKMSINFHYTDSNSPIFSIFFCLRM